MVEATILARLRDAVSEDGPGPFHHFTVDGTLIEAWASWSYPFRYPIRNLVSAAFWFIFLPSFSRPPFLI
jgi:hypothetical protein